MELAALENSVDRLETEVARLTAELEKARKDAERYRKWRDTYTSADNTDGVSDDDIMLGALANAWTPEAVDQAIDAAMTKEKPAITMYHNSPAPNPPTAEMPQSAYCKGKP